MAENNNANNNNTNNNNTNNNNTNNNENGGVSNAGVSVAGKETAFAIKAGAAGITVSATGTDDTKGNGVREVQDSAADAATGEDKPKGGNDTAKAFTGLPIESLICKPIVAAAQAQQELTAVYIDGIKKLAYDDKNKTNILEFSYDRPVIKQDGSMDSQSCSVKAPLLSLVPLPAFTMDELTVDFNMEVKDMKMSDSKTHTDASTTVKYNSWFGLDASITGNVSSDTEHKRQTDSTATYKIHARAVQQQPSEGMAKLTSLFAQAMEPIDTNKK